MALLTFAGAEDGIGEIDFEGTVTQSDTYARSGTYSFRIPLIAIGDNKIILRNTASNLIYFQFALYLSSSTIYHGDRKFIVWRNGTTVLGCLTIDEDSTGLKLYRGDKADLLDTIVCGLEENTWMLFEAKIRIDDSQGIFEFRKNGRSLIEFEGDTKPGNDTSIDNIIFVNPNINGGYAYWDDLIINDDQGSYINSWPCGLKIDALRPTEDGNYSQWTPSAGTDNYACIDETPPIIDDYVETDVSGHKDSYVMSDLIADCPIIKAVVSRYWGEGNGQIKSLMRIGTTDYLGDALTVPCAFSYVDQVRYLSPATGSRFTKDELNALQSGMEKV